MRKITALVRAWLLIDFFGDARRAGKRDGSSLTTTIFAQSFFALVFAWLLFPDTAPVPFAAANLCLSSLLIAIGALGDESRPERRAADEHLLRTAPLARLTVALARSGHAAFSIMLVTIGMALPPGILLAYVQRDALQFPAYVAGACVCSALACGVLGAIGTVAARWLGATRTALLLGSIKAVLLGGGLVLFATTLSRLQRTADAIPIGRAGAELLPPYHVARWLAAPGAETWRLAVLLAGGLVLLAVVAMIDGGAAARRHRLPAGSPLRALLARLAGGGPRLGIAGWVAVAMWRSAGFRARVLPLLGMPAAMAALALRDPTHDSAVLTSVLLQLPAIYLPFLVAFLPRADQAGTAWVFAQAPELSRRSIADATWLALVTHVLLPVHALALLLLGAVGGALTMTVPASLFACGVAIVAARVLAGAIDEVPFTRSREGDGALDLGATFANALLLGAVGAGFALLPAGTPRWLAASAALAVAIALLARAKGRAHTADTAPREAPDAPETSEPPPTEAADDARHPASLRHELRAIAVLYACLCLMPLAIGTLFAA